MDITKNIELSKNLIINKISNKKNNSNKDLPSEEELYKQIMLTNEIVWNNRLNKKDIDAERPTTTDNFQRGFKTAVFSILFLLSLYLVILKTSLLIALPVVTITSAVIYLFWRLNFRSKESY